MLTAPVIGSDATAGSRAGESILLLYAASPAAQTAAVVIVQALKLVAPVDREILGDESLRDTMLERLTRVRLCIVVVSDTPAFWDALPEIVSTVPRGALVFVFTERTFDYGKFQARTQELLECVLPPMVWHKRNRGPVQGAISFHDGVAEPHPVSPIDWKLAGTLNGRRSLNLARFLLTPVLVRNGFHAATGGRPRLGMFAVKLLAPAALLLVVVLLSARTLSHRPPAELKVWHYREAEAKILKKYPTAKADATHLTPAQLLQLSDLQSKMFSVFDERSCIAFLTAEPKYQDYALEKLPVDLVDQYFDLRRLALAQGDQDSEFAQDDTNAAFQHELLTMPDEQRERILQIVQKDQKDRSAAEICFKRTALVTNSIGLPEHERIVIAHNIGF